MFPPERIICPTDFSEAAGASVKIARRFAERYSSEIVLVYVVAEVAPMEFEIGTLRTFDLGAYREALTEDAKKQIQEIRDANFPAEANVRTVVLFGDAGRVIAELADNEKADLIVMATHGRSGFARLVLGSVAEKVIRDASCPVMIIPISS